MAITYPLSLPTNVSFTTARILARSVVGTSRSPFTGAEQVQKHQGQWFEFDGKLPPMARGNAEEWITFLLKLNGKQGTFLMGDPSGKTARGIGTGTPLINGGSQTGNSLITDGWTASQTGILKAGDYLQLGTSSNARLYKVLQEANSDGSGNATFDIWPSINTAFADNTALTISSPVGVFRLSTNEMPWDISTAQNYGIAFGATSLV
jgi:hypothetical protein